MEIIQTSKNTLIFFCVTVVKTPYISHISLLHTTKCYVQATYLSR